MNGTVKMSNRKTDWNPWLQEKRDRAYLETIVQQMLIVHDSGERVPEGCWDLLREAYDRVRKITAKST
jgi:hypothetical protein